MLHDFFDDSINIIADHFSKQIPVSDLLPDGNEAIPRQKIVDELNLFKRTYKKTVSQRSIVYLSEKNRQRLNEISELSKKNKTVPAHLYPEITHLSVSECIKLFFGGSSDDTRVMFETVYFIAMASLSIAVNSCDPERYFSVLKSMKTRLRSTMTEKHLDMLMELAINCDDAMDDEFFDEAIKTWYTTKPRRVRLDDDRSWSEFRLELDTVLTSPLADTTGVLFGSGFTTHKFGTAEEVSRSMLARKANRVKRAIQPVPESSPHPLLPEAHMDMGDMYAWPGVGNMTPHVGDSVAHWFEDGGDLFGNKDGWFAGTISKVNTGKNIDYDIKFWGDQLTIGHCKLSPERYGEYWVFLMNTSLNL